jgi:NADPH:quinone reductase-like Zn-dependent oxidoreductase
MRALRIEKPGFPEDPVIRDLPIPRPGPGEVLIQVKAAAINPSDVKNAQGRIHAASFPRTPGRDFAGVVVEGPPDLQGKIVFGSGGDLGFGRDGSHAEYLVVPTIAALPLPASLSLPQGAAIGVPYMTAWSALVLAARLQKGETVLITGTTGSVGGIAAWIARHLGARVIGTVRSAADRLRATHLPVDEWIDLESSGLAPGVRAATRGRGVDAIFDVVGGALFEPCLQSLAPRGRQVAIASNPEARVGFNLIDFYHNESRLLGVDSLKLGFAEAAEILLAVSARLESGELPPPKVETYPLDRAPALYHGLAAGTVKGKPVLVP